MAIKESILPEFEHEMETTRVLLARVPEACAHWKPHPKSRSLGELAIHLVELPRFVPRILESESFDPAPLDGERYVASKFESTDQMLARLDDNVGKARAALTAIGGDAELLVPWSLKRGGKTIFTVPRVAALRTFLLNHMIHHRGQLTVYLRLQNVPLPSIYGPTADQP